MLKEYEKYLDSLNLKEATKNVYLIEVSKFLRYSNVIKKSIKEIDYKDIHDYFISLEKHKIKKNTLNRKISSLRKYFNFLHIRGELQTNYFENIKLYKIKQVMPQIISYDKLLSRIDKIEDLEHKLILRLLLCTGIKTNELISLKIDNINITNRSIKLSKRTIYFNKSTKPYLEQYLNIHDYRSKYLFYNSFYSKINSTYLKNITDQYPIYGKHNKFTSKDLRISFASKCISEKIDTLALSILLGHESVRTTTKYFNDISTDLLKIANNYHPYSLNEPKEGSYDK